MSKRPQSVGAMAKASAFAAGGYFVDYTIQRVVMFWLAQMGPTVPTALTTVTVYVFIALALNEVVGSGSVSVISQAIGAGDRQDAQAKILKCLLLKLGLGSCLLAPIFLAIVWLDAAFIDKDAQIQKHIWSYAAVIWMSLIIIPVYTTLMTVMRAAAMGGPATFASLIALVINFCITPILVFGWFGAPELGVAGGALGAVFAQLATLVLCVFFIIRQRPDLLPARWPLPAIDHTLYRRIVMIGIPVGVTMLIFQ
ncbi:MAG: MATE family efflux transporter, partial [Pseudomonadota bacterium]|nr:MATE family efflux transporter [Pseudomonadota bacterium]